MKRDKILVRVNNLDEIDTLKKLGISNFLFALEDFSIGYNTFKISDLKNLNENIYLLLNRVLDNKGIDDFKRISDNLSFVKGIVFEDIGIYQIMKDKSIPLIWNQNHFAVNSRSINIWLEKVDSVIISNELEKSELKYVIDNVNKRVILPVLGLNMAMYSRRSLLSFFNTYMNLDDIKNSKLKTNNNTTFIAKENEYGTVLFNSKPFNLINEIDSFNDDNILYYYIDLNNIDVSKLDSILDGEEIDKDNRFYENKTVYRIGDLHD